MFAPNHHRLSPTLAKVRRQLGFPTIFNCVGPLCNPASAPLQLIGVWGTALVPKMASALARLVTTKSCIVNGNGLDEVSLEGSTTVAEVTGNSVNIYDTYPMDFGIEPGEIEGIRCSDSVSSSAIIRKVLNGEAVGTASEDIIVLNAAAAIGLADSTITRGDAVEVVRESIRSGKARRKLEELAAAIPA